MALAYGLTPPQVDCLTIPEIICLVEAHREKVKAESSKGPYTPGGWHPAAYATWWRGLTPLDKIEMSLRGEI